MKKYALFNLFIIGINLFANAQCPTTPVLLVTQAQVNAFPVNFPNCHDLGVRFEVKGAGITDLTPLSILNTTSKNFYVNFNPDLTSLSGLDNLTEVLGDFTIEANHLLTDLQGLGSLSNTPALLKVQNNDGLQTLDGLTAGGVLTTVGSLVVIENNSLTDMGSVYDALESVAEYVYIQDNASLTTLNTFNNLSSVGWYLTVDNHPSLTSLNAFGSLQSVGMAAGAPPTAIDFEIIDCPSLLTLNDFSSLSELGRNFEVTGNTSLTEMSFPSLTAVGGEMSIANNTSLTSLLGLGDFTLEGPLFILSNTSLPECEADGICNYIEVPGNPATINNNDPGCNNRNQVEAACLALPVELISFHGAPHDGDILLNWHTALEKDNSHFIVEHSDDGVHFKKLGQVKGWGTTSEPKSYAFHHQDPTKGSNYYRLKQVDVNGAHTYSGIVHVVSEHGLDVKIYPNPTTAYAKLRGDFTEGSARLKDISGRLIAEYSLPGRPLIDLTREPKGVYIVEIQAGNEHLVRRIIKE